MTTKINNNLDLESIHRYHDEGYLGPFTLCSPEEMAEIRERILSEIDRGPRIQVTFHGKVERRKFRLRKPNKKDVAPV